MEIENTEVENIDPAIVEGAIETATEVPAETPIVEAQSKDEVDPASTQTPEAPAWEPDYKFKVRDEELEMDPWVKGLVKDEETFKKFQDLYTRGHGLEIAKTERDEFKQKLSGLEESLGVVNELVQKGDTRGFIEALGLPKKMFIDYAINELKFQELPPEEQQRINAQRQQEITMQQLQAQNQELQNNFQAERTNLMEVELDRNLSSTYNGAAQAYEARTGVPGSFKQLVIERGIFHHKVNGNVIPVNQAIEEAMTIAGVQAGTPNPSQPVVTGTSTEQPKTETKKVLPNIQGQGTSPIKTSFQDLDSLKAHRKQKYGF